MLGRKSQLRAAVGSLAAASVGVVIIGGGRRDFRGRGGAGFFLSILDQWCVRHMSGAHLIPFAIDYCKTTPKGLRVLYRQNNTKGASSDVGHRQEALSRDGGRVVLRAVVAQRHLFVGKC